MGSVCAAPCETLQPQTGRCWVAGLGSGVPRGHGAEVQLFRERARPSLCSRLPLCRVSHGDGGDTKQKDGGTWPAEAFYPPPPLKLSWFWGQLCGVTLEILLLVPCY